MNKYIWLPMPRYQKIAEQKALIKSVIANAKHKYIFTYKQILAIRYNKLNTSKTKLARKRRLRNRK